MFLMIGRRMWEESCFSKLDFWQRDTWRVMPDFLKSSVPALVFSETLIYSGHLHDHASVSVYRLKPPVELLKSEKEDGEKPRKTNWIFAMLGLLLWYYYLSLTIKIHL